MIAWCVEDGPEFRREEGHGVFKGWNVVAYVAWEEKDVSFVGCGVEVFDPRHVGGVVGVDVGDGEDLWRNGGDVWLEIGWFGCIVERF